jgi:hypothetical protein
VVRGEAWLLPRGARYLTAAARCAVGQGGWRWKRRTAEEGSDAGSVSDLGAREGQILVRGGPLGRRWGQMPVCSQGLVGRGQD